MARGAAAKEEIIKKILETFEGSFKFDKEIRIPMDEGGETVQIKITLTCAKTNVECGNGAKGSITQEAGSNSTPADFMNEPTEQEKKNVQTLCEKLGLI